MHTGYTYKGKEMTEPQTQQDVRRDYLEGLDTLLTRMQELEHQNRVYREALEHIRYQLEMVYGYEAGYNTAWKTATKALDECKVGEEEQNEPDEKIG